MLFNSFEFIYLFLPVTWLGYYLIGRHSRLGAAAWVGIASIFFYGWWDTSALPVLGASIVFNYVCGLALSKVASQQSKPDLATSKLLVSAVATNLVYLGFYKYANFFVGSALGLMPDAGHVSNPFADVMLPIGISFFTFTQIAFLVDCKRGLVREQNFIHYVLFVTFFPHLIAGPVLHHAQMMPQFANAQSYKLNQNHLVWGVIVFTIGLGKKLLIADAVAPYADALFNSAALGFQPTFNDAWTGVLAYTTQIYFDFSGYSDMAVGLGLLFNIRLPVNFNYPYAAQNIIDFWRRWHISLSTFLRDYLYIALGGNRHGKSRRYINLMLTMLLGGLWHGANWTFIIWGGLHGLALVINHGWQKMRPAGWEHARIYTLLCWLLTFVFVCFTWVVFRADTMTAAMAVYKGMLGLNGMDLTLKLPGWKREYNLFLSLALVLYLLNIKTLRQWVYSEKAELAQRSALPVALVLFAAGIFILAIEQIGQASVFLYFQF